MEFASCYVQSTSIFASSAFLDVTAVFMILAAFAGARLIAMSDAGSFDQLQTVQASRM
ncbi:hypothetical protein [Mesorhizobium kowhaii]|uniref:hypothetical protein n=1 Tax=Mesorhizobium kowhaii TaxID=1300272 RepID=UPI00142DDCF2|nr:hypothetical protein [Mesorhizobium kowhaii]